MGFGRDLGAALTMGLTVNTEHKQAQDEHKKRVAAHDRAVGPFNATYHQTGEKIQALARIHRRDVAMSVRQGMRVKGKRR